MELILKQPENKHPCICILFDNEYEAGRYNQSIINQWQKYPFNIKFESSGSKLDMILKVRDYNFEFKYEDLKYVPDKFYHFLYNTKDSKAFSFCHIILKKDKHEVILTLTNRLLWVLKVDSVEFVEEY